VDLWRREKAGVRAARWQLPQLPEARVVTVISTWERPELLRQAVASALAQTVDDHVVLVINDGGRDPGLAAHDRLMLVTLPANIGTAGPVINVGIASSRSEYLAFLDDDNQWFPHHLEACLGVLRPGLDLAYSAMRRVRPDGTELDVISWPFDRGQLRKRRSVDTSTIVVRRGPGVRFSRVPRPGNSSPIDWEFVWRLSRRLGVIHVPEVTVRYLVNPDSHYSHWSPHDLGQVGTG